MPQRPEFDACDLDKKISSNSFDGPLNYAVNPIVAEYKRTEIAEVITWPFGRDVLWHWKNQLLKNVYSKLKEKESDLEALSQKYLKNSHTLYFGM